MEAAGAYIRTIREHLNMSRASLAHAVETHESQIVRIEKGQQDARGSLLLAIVHHIGGNTDVLYRLMQPDKTRDDGVWEANNWIQHQKRFVDNLINDTSAESFDETVKQFSEDIQADPPYRRAYKAFREAYWRGFPDKKSR